MNPMDVRRGIMLAVERIEEYLTRLASKSQARKTSQMLLLSQPTMTKRSET
jgi:chaperonin GroEL (HSP60 family)